MASVVQGRVVNHGSAPYKHDPSNNESYFVELQGDNEDKRVLWGTGIRDAIQLQNIKTGEEVAFYDKGLAEGSKKRNWDVERVERLKEHTNSIEHSTELDKDKTPSKTPSSADINNPLIRERYKDEEDEQEIELPSSVKNQYIIKVANRFLQNEKINFYDRDSKDGSIAFEDRAKSLHTSKEDEKTIKAMVDVAQAKNWSAIKLKGTEAFKREAWLEASLRGIEVKGYQPNEKDKIELQKRQEDRSRNELAVDFNRSKDINKEADKESIAKNNDLDSKVDTSPTIENDASWDKDFIKQNYNMSAYEAGLIAKAYTDKQDFEQAITQFHKEQHEEHKITNPDDKDFNFSREDAQKALVSFAVDHDKDIPDLDDQVWQQQLDGWDKQAEAEMAKFDQQNEQHLKAEAEMAMAEYEQIINTEAERQYQAEKEYELQAKADFEKSLEQDYQHEQAQLEAEAKAMAEFDKAEDEYQEFMLSPEERLAEREIERESLVRSNEFDVGRDVDYSGGSEVEAEVENFHNNIAVPTGINGMSKAEATKKAEASFDRKININQRNEVIEDKEAELSDKDKLAVEAWRRAVDYRFKDDPIKRQEKHDALDAKIPDIVAGKFSLEPPTIKETPSIEVSTRDMGSQDRTR